MPRSLYIDSVMKNNKEHGTETLRVHIRSVHPCDEVDSRVSHEFGSSSASIPCRHLEDGHDVGMLLFPFEFAIVCSIET